VKSHLCDIALALASHTHSLRRYDASETQRLQGQGNKEEMYDLCLNSPMTAQLMVTLVNCVMRTVKPKKDE